MHIQRGQHYINGQWEDGKGSTFNSINPATEQVIWQGKIASTQEITSACEAAHQAYKKWCLLAITERLQYLQSFSQQVTKQKTALTHLIAMETGKPLWEAATEVASVISKINISLEAYEERNKEKQFKITEAEAKLHFKPHGVMAVFGPFNFPAHLSNGHIVPALLAGNTIVYKPSEYTPAVAQFIVNCWEQAGLPPGVLNLLHGDSTCGKNLLSAKIQGVLFTGSSQAGRQIHQHFAGRPEIILALEMGGNNPLIIGDLDNIEVAVYYTILSAFISAGQRCTCARRLLIPQNAQGDIFLLKLIQTTKKIKVGDFSEQPEPFIGPVINKQHALNHLRSQQKLLQQGGDPLLLMKLKEPDTAFLTPGIINMSNANINIDEEIFAPLLQVYRYQNFIDAIKIANNTKYGLIAGLLSDNPDHYQDCLQELNNGILHWNRPTTGAIGNLPFGGTGWSGNHRPSGSFATDYCSYPIAILAQKNIIAPANLLPGLPSNFKKKNNESIL